MTIGEKIKFFRTQNNLTQKKLAEISEISEISIRKYEAGDRNPKLEQLQKLSNIFQINISLLVNLMFCKLWRR